MERGKREREKGNEGMRKQRERGGWDPQSRHVSLATLYAARLPCFASAPSFSLAPSFSHRRDPARFSAFLSSVSLFLSRSPRGTHFVLALGRRCAASGLLVPLCSRSFVQYSVRERRRGRWLKAGNGRQRPGGEKRQRRFSLARANGLTEHDSIVGWLGYGWFVRTIETSLAEGEPRESSGEDPGLSSSRYNAE